MKVILLALLLIIIPLSINATAQTQTFTREGVEYVLDLPSSSWRAVSRVDVHEHLEFVNGDDYTNGYLRLRKKVVTPDTTLKNLFREPRCGNYRSCVSRLPLFARLSGTHRIRTTGGTV